ncbi:MAG: hypothetical protein AABY22_24040, partial [Nanoarchaeota archaeon]
ANCVFKRDDKHKSPDGIENWTLHNKTKYELMLNCDPYETEYFLGARKVSEQEWKDGELKSVTITDITNKNDKKNS